MIISLANVFLNQLLSKTSKIYRQNSYLFGCFRLEEIKSTIRHTLAK